MMTPVLLAAASLVGSPQAQPPEAYWQRRGCEHGHRSAVSYRRIRTLVRHTRPAVDKRRVDHYATCVATRPKAHRAHELARRWWAWRHEYAQRWVIVFNRLPSWDRAWAWSTGACESGNNPATNTGNGYHGAHQWLISTWHAAGGTGLPEQHSWYYQAVIAVRWMHVAGTGQWPVCGR
jgi:hypothetical protein